MACEENNTYFTFIWKLENVDYCLEGKDEAIDSPEFVVDWINETKWYLAIYPRGAEDEKFIAFYLFRKADGKPFVPRAIHFELAFINNNGSILQNIYEYDFSEWEGYGCPDFVEREEVFITKRSTFLQQDTLTARCRIWKSDLEDIEENVCCLARTRIGVQKRSFLWNVKNFSSLQSGKKYTYEMKSVNHEKETLSINLFLTEGLGSEQIIRFELTHQDKSIKFSILQLYLVDASKNRLSCNREEYWFEEASETKEFKFCFTKNKLMQMKNSYLFDDILSLHWEFEFSMGVVANEIEGFHPHACASSSFKASPAQNMNGRKKISISYSLSDNVKSLYDENFLCDVKLKTTTRTFNAHKIILSSSSSVFKAMFSNDMKEKDSGFVNIEDISDDTINRMLHFIYTTSLEDLTWVNASHLYVAADKYAILSLKEMCSSYLKDNLSLSNACEALLLSYFHADDDLKVAIQDYMLKNMKDIVNCNEWKGLMETNPKLAAETVCLQYK